ncbi:acyltransferase [Agrilactobacillus fermenti]|uniref:acyltransferase n=1 Tax=Agrilactobacillus fermenti TaxID=2586909 RepID=UPI001E3CFEA5|nr:acyltransferase [Agrilactobacillus fermenti]MCD2256521.1 acyltransferase [Agrilactobacillus fermenti]
MERKWDYGLDFTRAIAAIFVITVHVFASNYNTDQVAYVGDLIASSGVFMFIVISGYTNSMKYEHIRRGPTYPYMLKKAFFKLLVPYFFWSLFYMIVNTIYKHQVFFSQRWFTRFLNHLWLGNTWFHLYFMVLLIYLYLIYPFFFRLIKRRKGWPLTIFLLVSPAILYLIMAQIKSVPWRSFMYFLPINWWGIMFVLGIILAIKTSLTIWHQDFVHFMVALSLTIASFFGYLMLNDLLIRLQKPNEGLAIVSTYLRLLYSLAAFLLLYIIGSDLFKLFPGMKRFWHVLSRHSYTMYLSHPFLIFVMEQLRNQHLFFKTNTTGTMFGAWAIIILATFILSALLDNLIKYFRGLFQEALT